MSSSAVRPGPRAALDDELRRLGRVLVAFSGGADSALLLAVAVRVLGLAAVSAATAVSASLPASELAAARRFAAGLGVEHLTPATRELDRAGYVANAGDRCFHCKAELAEVLAPLAAARAQVLVTGTNADDLLDPFRPGIRAAAQRGARTPLADAGWTKAVVRAESRRLGLVTWDKPAAACLSSRLAVGLTVTPARLARVERAERALRAALAEAGLQVVNLRVRDRGDHATVEVDAEWIERIDADLLAVVEGFPRVCLDPRGFRSGALNEA